MRRRAAVRMLALATAGVIAPLLLPRSAAALTSDQQHDFERRFTAAFGEQHLDRAMALFHWRGVSTADRDRIVALILRDLAYQMVRFTWLPPGERGDFMNGGQRMRGNLPSVARFAVEFLAANGEPHVSVHDIGVHEGSAFIALAEPVPAAA